jgi:thiamine-monophosphate kinase
VHENALLAHIFTRSQSLVESFPQVLLGPGDDCAVIEVNDGSPILFKVDQLIEHRHFTSETPLSLIARKAIARPLSDIAAMAGSPVAALAACTLPKDFPQARADALFDAVNAAGIALGVPVVGGDIASFRDTNTAIVLSISLIGRVHPRRGPVRRSSACVGDHVYVTGSVGDTFAAAPTPQDAFPGGGKHLRFTPRLQEATWLADSLDGQLHAMMDISDGLGVDAARIALASGIRIELDASAIPLTTPTRGVEQSIADGEDYELLFTVDPSAVLPQRVPGSGTMLTRVGVVTAGSGCGLRIGPQTIDISTRGWEHA